MATKKLMSTYSMLTFRLKQLMHFLPVKMLDLSLFQEVLHLAQQNMVIIGQAITRQLGNSFKVPSPTFSIVISTDSEWLEKISVDLLVIPQLSFAQDGISWELFIPFLVATTQLDLSHNNLMPWEI